MARVGLFLVKKLVASNIFLEFIELKQILKINLITVSEKLL